MEETIRNWAEENNIILSDIQVEDLSFGIQMEHEMEMYSTGWTLGYKGKTEEEKKIEELEETISQLIMFCSANGYNVSANSKSVTHRYMVPISCSHSSSQNDIYKYGEKIY